MVVLPAPFGPSSAVTVPAVAWRLTSDRATVLP
jgi:hypothetical protein